MWTLLDSAQNSLWQRLASDRPASSRVRPFRCAFAALCFGLVLLTGCGGGGATPETATNAFFSITPPMATIDTSCTGCNVIGAHGSALLQFTALRSGGGPADVVWTLSGGDAAAGPGTISASGQYAPPTYLTADRVQVRVHAALKSAPQIQASAVLTLIPGFLQPLSPENVTLGPGGSVSISGTLAEAGGGAGIHFSLASSPTGTSGGMGSLSAPLCQRTGKAFTTCTVTYTAPASVTATSITYVIATAGESLARTETAVLLNAAGVSGNPVSHQSLLTAPMALGSSGGNNEDFDQSGNSIIDCCSGTLGSLVQDADRRQYILSNNHILARSDRAAVGDAIIQPGLIDNNCTPNGEGPGTVPVGSLTEWLSLRASTTNVDAAIAQVASRTVDPSGSILELGSRQPDGSLSAAPPGIVFSGGLGEEARLQMRVAKSGRTTGLTCGGVSAIDVDISVDYFRDCAETRPYLSKLFKDQIGLSGNRFSDAGDSGALVVDTTNAEPVGLYFAGGTDVDGVVQGMANPAGEVLRALDGQAGGSSNFTYVGGPDHPVSCLSFGDSTIVAAQARALSDSEIARVQQALILARQWINPTAGVLGIAMGKSSDHAGEAAVIVYVDQGSHPAIPPLVAGIRTVVITATARAVALGAAPMAVSLADAPPLQAPVVSKALAVKQAKAQSLMEQNRAFFGVGVGQSLDNPREASLVIYVDRRHLPGNLPPLIDGIRTRYIVMDRLHVTRSFAASGLSLHHCMQHSADRLQPFQILHSGSLRLP